MYYFMRTKFFGRKDVIMPEGMGNVYHTDVCEACGSCFAKPEPPVKFVMRGDPCDFYVFWSFIFISDRFKEILEQLEVTGYKTRPAKVVGWNKSDDPDEIDALKYHELIVTGRCGFMRDLKGDFIPKCDVCGNHKVLKDHVNGLGFANEDYDGSDIFVFSNQTNFPIVSDKLKKQLSKAKLSNVKFIPIDTYVF